MTEPISSKSLKYEDSLVKVSFDIKFSEVSIEIYNKTNKIMRVNWDNSVLVLNNKQFCHRVIREETYFASKDLPNIPLIIAPNSMLSENVYPVDHVYYMTGKNGGFRTKPMLNVYSYRSIMKSGIKKDDIVFVFLVEIGGNNKYYSFTFTPSEIIPAKY
jgi:hypothetical protein